MKLNEPWVIIPAFNENKNITDIVKRSLNICNNVIVVDDGSKDNTGEIAKKEGAIVLTHPLNMGKGAALKTGCDYALTKKAKIIIVLDADGQHKPEDIPRFIDALKGNDIVFGSRKINKNMPFIFRLGNYCLNKFSSMLFGIYISDTQSGFRAFKSEIYPKIRWESSDYSMESEMIANVGKHKLKFKEITIDTIYGDKYKGTTIIDGLKIGLRMIKMKVNN